jgi:ABC-type polysaccharide/polyol phosphate export permease
VCFPWNLYWEQRLVLVTLVRTQISRRHRRSFLGWSWNIIQPGSQAIMIFAVTQGVIRVAEGTTPLGSFGYFFVALILAQGVGEIAARGPTLVTERPGWVKGSLFPLELFAPIAVGVALYRILAGGLVGLLCVLIGEGVAPALETLAMFALALILAMISGAAIGLMLATVGVYVRDAALAAPVISMYLTFVSPIFVASSASDILTVFVLLNPVTMPMSLVLFGPQWVTSYPVYAVLGVLTPIVALWLSAFVFRRTSASFADYV